MHLLIAWYCILWSIEIHNLKALSWPKSALSWVSWPSLTICTKLIGVSSSASLYLTSFLNICVIVDMWKVLYAKVFNPVAHILSFCPQSGEKEFQECCSGSLETAARECLGNRCLIKFFLKVDEGFLRKLLRCWFVFVIPLSLIFLWCCSLCCCLSWPRQSCK